jgi:hypothetical protein
MHAILRFYIARTKPQSVNEPLMSSPRQQAAVKMPFVGLGS